MTHWNYGYGLAGYHYLNLVGPIVIALIATQDPLKPPTNRWRDTPTPDVSPYIREPLTLYTIVHPNEHEFIDGAVLRAILSLERKLYLIGWGRGVYIPKLDIPQQLQTGNDYTAWCIAKVIREEFLRVYDYYYPELGLTKNGGYLKAPQISKLMSYKLIPPFIIYDRVQRFLKGI